jgi:hypothetical protein
MDRQRLTRLTAIATPLRLLLLAACGAVLEVLAFALAGRHTFGEGHPLLHGEHRWGAHAILWLGGLWVASCALAASYRALRRWRAAPAAAVLLAGFPLLVIGVASLYGSCLLRSWL